MIPFPLLLSGLIVEISQNKHRKIFIRENFLWPARIWRRIDIERDSHLCGWAAAFWKESHSSKLALCCWPRWLQGPPSTGGVRRGHPRTAGEGAEGRLCCALTRWQASTLSFGSASQIIISSCQATLELRFLRLELAAEALMDIYQSNRCARIVVNSKALWLAAKETPRASVQSSQRAGFHLSVLRECENGLCPGASRKGCIELYISLLKFWNEF